MRGFLAVTDPGWYERLAAVGAHRGPMEANFWLPSPRRVLLLTGTPFLFKLRAGERDRRLRLLRRFSVLPDWLAWDTFGESSTAWRA